MKPLKSLRGKFVRTMLLVTSILGISTLAIVVTLSAQTSAELLASVQKHTEAGISSKGKVLTENHALALRSLTLDNAFLDMQRLVEQAVQGDPDLVYGVYINAQREPLAYSQQGLVRTVYGAEALQALQALQIQSQELLVDHLVMHPARRLGQDLLEIAAPVVDEQNEVVGTIRYGLSTHRMQQALLEAKADSQARLLRTIALLGLLVGLTTLLGLLLSRIQAVRITRPLGELTGAAASLAAGDRSVRVSIQSGDELEGLGESFNRMVRDLDASCLELEGMNRTLEHKVDERTSQLAHKNRDMRLLLDNVEQGFATLSVDGTLALECSRVVREWFGDFAKPLPLWRYIEPRSPAFAAHFEVGWEQVVDDLLPLDLVLHQLPRRLSHGGRSWRFDYRPYYGGDRLEGVLLVVSEITERLAKEQEEAVQHELMQAFKKLLMDRSGLDLFLREAGQTVEALCNRSLEADGVVVRRALHTLKGSSASIGFTALAEICHALEEQLVKEQATSDELLARLMKHWSSITGHIAELGGVDKARAIEIPALEYEEFLAHLTSGGEGQRALLAQALTWQLEPVAAPFRRLAEQAKRVATSLDKGDIEVRMEPNGVRLDAKTWSPFFAELVHVVRNAVDHGLETPAEREALGKPAHGTLLLKAERSSSELSFEIADDGRGIDWQAVALKARALGLPHQTQNELIQALCHDGLSTSAQVTLTSGRGVGMAAVDQCIKAMTGQLQVHSEPHVGTRVVVRFPWAGTATS